MYSITIFKSKFTKGKVPISPYNNRTFKFTTLKCQTLSECAMILSSNWILSNALNINDDLIEVRDKQNLSKFRDLKNNLMVLDLDKITSIDSYYKIINFFKEKNLQCVLIKSKSFNGIDNFNLKGFLHIQYDNTIMNIKKHIDFLAGHLGDWCIVDKTVKNDVSFQAPTNQTDIVYIREKGNHISLDNLDEVEKENKNYFINIDSKVIFKCMEIYTKLGYNLESRQINDNSSINWSHHSEVKSKGGFFMFLQKPFVMYHNNSSRTLSIWNIFKKTNEGKEYLKMLFKKQQEENIIDISEYQNLLVINERFINVDNCINIIEEFLKTSDSVLKIKSAMGTGKSLIIDKIIEKTNERILIISNRISVALDYSKKYKIKTYLDQGEDKWKPGENLIVQLDSLHKYKLKDFDVIVLDEFISLLFQTRSELSKENKNFNLSKFYSILNGSRKVIIADAFLNGKENNLFRNKKMFYIRNDYRDKITHYNYKHKEMFLSSLIKVLQSKKPDESVTVSIMSNNVLNAMEKTLLEMGYNVATLTASTPELRKKRIYELFNDPESVAWDIILYSPTLTVGVSNLNNVKHHFHYDTGNSADVISSLQMIKRSRRATILHTFLKETQKYNPITNEDLDILSNNDIISFFNGKQTTLLIDVDEDGEFKLSELGKFCNKIEALYNILENNHGNAFKLLMNEQFSFDTNEVLTNDNSYNFHEMIKKYKEEIKHHTIEMIEKHKNCEYSDEYILELRAKTIDLSNEEKTALILDNIKKRVSKNITHERLIELAELDVKRDGKFVKELEMLNDSMSSKDEIQKKLSILVANNVSSIQNKDIINFYTYLDLLNISKLQKWYSENEINAIDEKLNQGKKFKSFLKKLGFKRRNGRMELSEDHIKFYKYL